MEVAEEEVQVVGEVGVEEEMVASLLQEAKMNPEWKEEQEEEVGEVEVVVVRVKVEEEQRPTGGTRPNNHSRWRRKTEAAKALVSQQ